MGQRKTLTLTPIVIQTKEFCQLLGISTHHFHRLRKQGVIPDTLRSPFGGKWHLGKIHAWLAQNPKPTQKTNLGHLRRHNEKPYFKQQAEARARARASEAMPPGVPPSAEPDPPATD